MREVVEEGEASSCQCVSIGKGEGKGDREREWQRERERERAEGWIVRLAWLQSRGAVARMGEADDSHDLTSIANVGVPTVVDVLRARALQGLIYSSCGPLLVAVNPYRLLPIYGEPTLGRYLSSATPAALPPHVYGVGAAVVQAFRINHRSQAVIVSGESGAGKTETCKRLLEFLSASSAGGVAGSRNMHARVIQTNPMLESLGCAKTLRNDNSSRYGKFITIRHDASGGVRAAHIETYLLEKSRVTHRGKGEHNFHILYELVRGASAEVLEDLRLVDAPEEGWNYLSNLAERTLEADRDNFAELLKGFEAVGFSAKMRNQLLSTLAGILWLGQIKIVTATNAQGEQQAMVGDENALRVAAMLLGCEPADLFDGLCIRCIKAGNDWVKSQYTPAQARSVRDGFAQAIYAGVFGRVVEQANISLAAHVPIEGTLSSTFSTMSSSMMLMSGSLTRNSVSGYGTPREHGIACSPRNSVTDHGGGTAEPDGSFIGLLDIFGFEALGVNSLEQLCINYANEKLQDMFVTLMIERTQQLYASEGVYFDAAAVPKYDRGSILLLDAIFRSLTEECVLPRGSDVQMLDKLLRQHEANPHFNAPPPKLAIPSGGSSQQRVAQVAAARRRERMVSSDTRTFVVSHFAGRVRYSVEGFLLKNRDPLSQDLQVMMQWSTVPLLKRIFAVGSGSTNSTRFHGVVERFLSSLRALLETIASANIHFIRCIKPNEVKQPNFIDAECVAKQVTSSGLVPAIGISRAGFSTHMPREDFAAMFGPPWERGTGQVLRRPVDDAQLLELLHWVGAAPSEYCVGKTRVFLRNGVLDRLELVRYNGLNAFVIRVQIYARRLLAIRMAARLRDELLNPRGGVDGDDFYEEDGPCRVLNSSQILRGDSFSRRVGIRKTLDQEQDRELIRRKASFDRKCKMFGTVVKTRRPPMADRRGESSCGDEFEATNGGMNAFVVGAGRGRGGPDAEDGEDADGSNRVRSMFGLRAVGAGERGCGSSRATSTSVGAAWPRPGDTQSSSGLSTPSSTESMSRAEPSSPGEKAAAEAGQRAMMAEIQTAVADQEIKWPLEYVVEFAHYLGFVLPEDADLLWIADEALNEGEQPDWEECLDIRGGLYYQHRVSGTVLTQHPIDFHYQRYYYFCKVDPALRKDVTPDAEDEVGLARNLSLTRDDRRPSAHLRATMPKNFDLLHFETIIERREGLGLGVVFKGGIVQSIKPGVECGLQVGDRVTAVDGHTVYGSIGNAIEPSHSHTLSIERWVPDFQTESGNLCRNSSGDVMPAVETDKTVVETLTKPFAPPSPSLLSFASEPRFMPSFSDHPTTRLLGDTAHLAHNSSAEGAQSDGSMISHELPSEGDADSALSRSLTYSASCRPSGGPPLDGAKGNGDLVAASITPNPSAERLDFRRATLAHDGQPKGELPALRHASIDHGECVELGDDRPTARASEKVARHDAILRHQSESNSLLKSSGSPDADKEGSILRPSREGRSSLVKPTSHVHDGAVSNPLKPPEPFVHHAETSNGQGGARGSSKMQELKSLGSPEAYKASSRLTPSGESLSSSSELISHVRNGAGSPLKSLEPMVRHAKTRNGQSEANSSPKAKEANVGPLRKSDSPNSSSNSAGTRKTDEEGQVFSQSQDVRPGLLEDAHSMGSLSADFEIKRRPKVIGSSGLHRPPKTESAPPAGAPSVQGEESPTSLRENSKLAPFSSSSPWGRHLFSRSSRNSSRSSTGYSPKSSPMSFIRGSKTLAASKREGELTSPSSSPTNSPRGPRGEASGSHLAEMSKSKRRSINASPSVSRLLSLRASSARDRNAASR